MKVVINKCYGGFSISRAAYLRLKELGCECALAERDSLDRHEAFCRDISRHEPLLIQVINELGESASGTCAKLGVINIPDGISYSIEEYDGNEWIAETHNTWS